MKKIFLFFMILFLCSCGGKYSCTMTYKIYYPSNTIVRTTTLDGYNEAPYVHSYEGSNYLRYGAWGVESTTVPLELISYKLNKKVK